MDFNNYSSIFELFAGINIALMLSDTFIANINSHFSNSYIYTQNSINETTQKIETVNNNIDEISEHSIIANQPSGNNNSSQIKIKDLKSKKTILKSKIVSFEKRIYQLSNEVIEKKRLSEISCKFKFICLYASIYCILILLLSGIISEEKQLVKQNLPYLLEAISIFNIVTMIIYMCYIAKDSKRKFSKYIKRIFVDGYLKTIIHFFLAFIITVVYYIIHKYQFTSYQNPGIVKLIWLFIGSMFVATFHFPYYFFRTLLVAKRDTKKISDELKTVLNELNDFNDKEVIPLINVSDFIKQ